MASRSRLTYVARLLRAFDVRRRAAKGVVGGKGCESRIGGRWSDPAGVVMVEDELPFHLLTETERRYLRLVHQGYTSRDIAIERGVRPDSVDKVLRMARRKLGDFDRRELARRLVEAEARQAGQAFNLGQPGSFPPAQSLGVQTPKLDQTPEMAPLSAPTQPNDSRSNSAPRDTVIKLLDLTDGAILRRLLFGARRSPTNDLDPWSRFAIMSVVAACAACAAVAIVPLLIVIERLAARL